MEAEVSESALGRFARDATTAGGVPFRIRPIRPEDVPLLARFFEDLSPETLFMRFHGVSRPVTPALLSRLATVDLASQVALVALMDEPEGSGRLMVAEGRLFGREGEDLAELAVLVADPWQGQGIGAALLEQLVSVARERRIKRAWGLVRRENRRMIRLAERLGAVPRYDPRYPVVEITLALLP